MTDRSIKYPTTTVGKCKWLAVGTIGAAIVVGVARYSYLRWWKNDRDDGDDTVAVVVDNDDAEIPTSSTSTTITTTDADDVDE